MPQVVDRFSVSLDIELLAAFDRHITARGYDNRSEAVRDMIRDLLVSSRAHTSDEVVTAFLTVVCDHRVGDAGKRVRACLTEYAPLVIGTLHVPIDGHRDGLVVTLRGPSDRVRAAADQLQAMRGATHGHLSTIPMREQPVESRSGAVA
jgi:CopG family nickel-responsive transcriptional regulator